MKKSAERAGSCLIALGMLMLTASAVLVYRNSRESTLAQKDAERHLAAAKAYLDALPEQSYADIPVVQQVQQDGAYVPPEQPVMPEAVLDGNAYIGIIRIPAVNMELPVMQEVTMQNLKSAPCYYSGALQTKDLVICGHNYQSSFGKLHHAAVGDAVYFTAMDGKEYAFHVAECEVLMPNDISGMTAGNYPLSLYTCTYNGTRRLTVRCTADHPSDLPESLETDLQTSLPDAAA